MSLVRYYLSLLNHILPIIIIILSLPWLRQIGVWLKLVAFAVVFAVLALMPVIQGVTIGQFLTGISGELSFSLTIIVIISGWRILLFHHYRFLPSLNSIGAAIIVVVGGALYLSAFGFITIDFYDYGYLFYHYTLTAAIIISCCLYLMLYINKSLAIIWLIAFIAYIFHLQSSTNIWNYFFDPVLWLLAMIVLGINGRRLLKS